jgi:hypothetical protein
MVFIPYLAGLSEYTGNRKEPGTERTGINP